MFQNLVVTGVTPLCNTDEIQNWDNRPFNGNWPENQQRSVRGSEVKKPIRKKPKRVRTAYSTDQLRTLERIYSSTKYIDSKQRKQLAETLKIGEKALKIWFQNRRMKEKKESSESSCDTSSDIVSCQSPTLTNESVEEKTDAKVPFSNYYEPYELAQYQFPTPYCNEDGTHLQYQNGYSYEPSYGVDASVYPTQYYPFNNQYNNVIDVNAYNQVQNGYEMDNWYAKSFDLSYFTT